MEVWLWQHLDFVARCRLDLMTNIGFQYLDIIADVVVEISGHMQLQYIGWKQIQFADMV